MVIIGHLARNDRRRTRGLISESLSIKKGKEDEMSVERVLDEEDVEMVHIYVYVYMHTDIYPYCAPPSLLSVRLSLFLLLFSLAHPRSLPAFISFLRRAPPREVRTVESLYHHGCSNNRGLTVPAIYCGHIFILTLIATWYRPRA